MLHSLRKGISMQVVCNILKRLSMKADSIRTISISRGIFPIMIRRAGSQKALYIKPTYGRILSAVSLSAFDVFI